MNEEFWKKFPPIPGFDCVEMKRKAQARIYQRTKGMSTDKMVEYYKRVSKAFAAGGKIDISSAAEPSCVRESSEEYGRGKK